MKLIKAYWPAGIWLFIVTVLSTRGGVPMPNFNLIGPDKVAHAASYFVLAALMLYGYSKMSGRTPGLKGFAVVFALAAGYGVLMEWVQKTFFPNRFFEFDDMIANSIGAALAVLFWYLRSRRETRLESRIDGIN
ncbi:MAG: VanZ family protein [Saprospiraceae bacterium]|nr:VanZ family protein [Saprospiraceae bacterium]